MEVIETKFEIKRDNLDSLNIIFRVPSDEIRD